MNPEATGNTDHGDRSAGRFRYLWYAAAVFLSSAFLMVLEIVAGRLIAPYVGVSLYTWTSIIGVILAGLSLGNWIGGVWADRGGNERSAGIILALAGVFSLAILLILTFVAPFIQSGRLNLLGSSFLYVLTLFFVPAVLLGVVTPLLTALALRLDTRTGHVVGRMHALAALGSILGTFLTGYVLIQYLGVVDVIIGTAIALFLLALPFLRLRPITAPVAIIGTTLLLTAATYARDGFISPCEIETNYFCIRVVDSSEMVPFGNARSMVLDHLVHGTNHAEEPGVLLAPYVHLMDEMVLHHFDAEAKPVSYFFAGGGAFTLPRAIHESRRDANITVAELDPLVTRTAQEQLFLRTDGMRVLHEDARVALGRLEDERFDVIVGDAFHDISIPYHLVTREYVQLVKSRLSERGMYVANVLDAFPDARLVKAMMRTLSQEFHYVDVWLDVLPDAPERLTLVITASDVHAPPEFIDAKHGLQRRWFRITEPMLALGTPYASLPVLTDNFVPVERLVSDFYTGRLGL